MYWACKKMKLENVNCILFLLDAPNRKTTFLVSVPGYCFPLGHSHSGVLSKTDHATLLRDLAPHSGSHQDAQGTPQSYLCYLPTLSPLRLMDFLPVLSELSLPWVLRFSISCYSNFTYCFILSLPPLWIRSLTSVLSKDAQPLSLSPWFVSPLYGLAATWGCEFSFMGLSLSDCKPFIPYQMITSWGRDHVL